jgi:hypothetical protein
MEVPGRTILTPAVMAAAAFAVLAAFISVTFVSSRGGLQLPVAATAIATASLSPGAALASESPAGSPIPSTATPAASPPPGPSTAPSAVASEGPSPSAVPSAPSPRPSPSGPVDPLLALEPCPGQPGCFEYVVRRGDAYSAINDRFGLLLWITDALNPEVADKGIIVVGQTLFLGRDPEARLEACPDGAACRLYAVPGGDTLSGIAARFGLGLQGILTLNPGLSAAGIGVGDVIRLPLFEG